MRCSSSKPVILSCKLPYGGQSLWAASDDPHEGVHLRQPRAGLHIISDKVKVIRVCDPASARTLRLDLSTSIWCDGDDNLILPRGDHAKFKSLNWH